MIGRSLQSLDLGVGIQFNEVADPEGQIGVYEQLCGFSLGISKEQGFERILERLAE